MKRFISYSLVFVNSICSAIAQDIIKFGKVDDDLVKMESYDNDASAEAVIIQDIGDSKFIYDQNKSSFRLQFDRHMIIKVLSKDGYDWADHEIELYQSGADKEEVFSLKGNSYNLENGKVVKTKLDKSSIFYENKNDFWDVQKFTMPNVKEGTVIEFTYTVMSDFFFNLRSWQFQHDIPVVYSEYNTAIPQYFTYRKITQGYHPMSLNEEKQIPKSIVFRSFSRSNAGNRESSSSSNEVRYQDFATKLIATNVPAMREETYVSSMDNYVTKIDFELQSTQFPGADYKDYRNTWATLNSKLLETRRFGLQAKHARFTKNDIGTVSGTPEEKIAQVYEFVKKNVKWNRFNSIYATFDTEKAYKDGEGSVADINLLLTGMLRDQDIQADPVLISTRDNGLIRETYPITGQFNYVIVAVKLGDEIILLDATNSTTPIGFLQEKCLNTKGWAVSDEGGYWVDLSPGLGYKKSVSTQLMLNEDGSLVGALKLSSDDYASFKSRREVLQDGEEKYVEQFTKKNSWLKVGKHSFENAGDISSPFIENYDVEVVEMINSTGELIFFNPMIAEKVAENPFKNETRIYPVDFTYPRSSVYSLSLTIPEGYEVDEIPEAVSLALPDGKGSFTYSVSAIGGELKVISMLKLKEYFYLSSDYPYLREFFGHIVAKHGEQVVLKKKV